MLTLDAALQVIENILDDDQDLEDMNLGARAEAEDKILNVRPWQLARHACCCARQMCTSRAQDAARLGASPEHGSAAR